MADEPDTLVFGAPSGGNPQGDTPPDTLSFGIPTTDVSEPTKWTGTASLPYQAPSWADTGHSLAAGAHELGAQGASWMASHTSDDSWQKTAEEQRKAAAESIAVETYGGKEAREGSFWAHPMFQAAEAAPGLVAAAAPAIIGGMTAGPIGAVIGGAAGFGEYQRGQAVDDYSSKIMDTPTEVLRRNPEFDHLSQYMSDDDAKRTFIRSELDRNGLPWKSELLGAAVGAIGPAAEFGGAPISKIFGDKLVNRILAGGLEQSGNMAALSGGQTALSGAAEQQSGIRGPVTPGEVASSALQGAEGGAQFGVAGAFLHRGAKPGQSGTSVRSRTDYRKTKEPEGNTDQQQAGATGPAQPGGIVGDAEKDALAGKPINQGDKLKAKQAAKSPSGVTQPTDVQGEAVQPMGVGPEDQQGAPPAGQEAPPVSPPTAGPSPPVGGAASPAAAPAPAAETVTPEPRAVQEAQHAALTDPSNSREAMVYPPGGQPLPLPSSRYGQIKLADGRIIQFDREGPNLLTTVKIKAMDRQGRLNDLLQMGPVDKQQAIDRVSAGEQPAAVTETTDTGVPVKEAVGTAATAPDQVAAMEATKTPGSTVHVEDVATPILRREEGLAAEQQGAQAAPTQEQVIAKIKELGGAPSVADLMKAFPGVEAKQLDEIMGFARPARDVVAEAKAALAAREAERVAAPEVPPRVTPEEAPLDPLAGATKLAANPRTGVELHQAEDGTYLFKNKEGKVLPIEEGNARAFFPEVFKQEAAPVAAMKEEKAAIQADRLSPELEAARQAQAQRRILRSETPEEQAAAARQAEADRLAAERVATEQPAKPVTRQTKEPEEQKPGKDAKRHEANIASNVAADEVVRNNLPQAGEEKALETARGSGGQQAREQVKARVVKMVKEAIEHKFQFMEKLKDRKGEGAHSASSILLHEAKRLADLKVPKTSDYKRYLDRERDLLKGEAAKADVLKERRAAGKEFAAAAGKAKEVAVEGVEGGEAAGGIEQAERPDAAEEYEKAKESVAEQKVAQEPGEQRQMTEKQRAAVEAGKRAAERIAETEKARAEGGRERAAPAPKEGEEPAVRGFGQAAGFQVAKKGERVKLNIKPKEEVTPKGDEHTAKSDVLEDEEAPAKVDDTKTGDDKAPAEGYKRYQTGPEKGDYVDLKVERASTAGEAIHRELNINKYAPWLRPLMQKLRDAIVKIAGDTPVYYVKHAELLKKLGEEGRAYGKYSPHPKNDFILINADRPKHDTSLHEAYHAATIKGIRADPALQKGLRAVLKVMGKFIEDNPDALEGMDTHQLSRINAALKDETGEELLTYMMTNEHVQQAFRMATIPEDLARELGVPKWRVMTAWNAALTIMRRAMGLGPREYSAIEAMTAISEQLLWQHPRGVEDLKGAAERLSHDTFRSVSDRIERDQDAYVKSPKEKIQSIRDIDTGVAKQFAKDARTNIGSSLMKQSLRFLSGTWLNDIHGHLFKDAAGNILEAINHARDKVSSTYSTLRKGDLDMINRGYRSDVTNRTSMGDYGRLLDMSLRYNIHADRDAPEVKALGKSARKDWQRDKFGDEARQLYRSLPSDLQKRYREEKKYYTNKQGQMADVILEKSLPLFDPPPGSDLEEVLERARNNELTDEDWEHYENEGAGNTLREAYRLAGRKDAFFNGQRAGDKVVTGRYEMPKGGKEVTLKGDDLPDNQREFDTEAAAHAYATGTRLHATTREAYYVKDGKGGYTDVYPKSPDTDELGLTGKKVRSEDADLTKYRVSLERQHTMFAHTKAEALRNRAHMEALGVKELSGVLDKRDESAWSQLNSADQNVLERKIDSRKDLTAGEKQNMKDASRQMMLTSHTGMSSHFAQSRKVGGGQFSSADALDAYSRQVNFHIARESHSAELEQAMQRMDVHEKSLRSSDPANADRRSMVVNEMRNRVYGGMADALSSRNSPFIHRLMTYAFINFLVRPSHIFLSQIHPWVYSVPMMGARHGLWKAMAAQKQAQADLGGNIKNLGRGVAAGYKIFKSLREKDAEKAIEMAHGADPIKDMINRLGSAEERKFLTQMYETEHLHSAFDTSMFAGKGIDYTNAIMRQFTDAMEANNRLSTALASYRLEKAMHKDPAGALAYARRVIEESHGVYSPTNIAPVFRNPIMRPMMQFHQQPMNLAMMMYRNIAKAAPEIMGGEANSEARWTLTYQLGTAMMLGGMGGMPLDLPKLASIASMPFGGPSPADWADKEQKLLVTLLGNTGANLINEGLPAMMGPLGPSLGHRTGFDAGFVFGEPSSGAPKDMIGWAAQQLIGAAPSMVGDWMSALQSIEAGDYQRGMEGALPGSLKDIAKAYRLGTQGQMAGRLQVYPASVGDSILQLLGFSGVERERALAGHQALKKALAAEGKGKSAVVTRVVQGDANQGDVAKWNAANPHNKITASELKSARQTSKNVLGVRTSPRTALTAQEFQHAYQ